jgi:GNAT superfamily N-acetyltransferase
MADCEYQIGGQGKFYSESEFKKLLSEGYLDKVMIENKIKIRNIKPNEELAKIFQMPAAIQTQAPTETKDNYKIAQDVTSEVSRENPDASVLLTPKGEDLSLTAVYVGKENRGKGIGTKVLESVKKQADKLGKKIVLDATTELDEETDLGRLESFYQNNGFTKVGENKFEYSPTTEATTGEVVTEEKSFDDKVAEEYAKSLDDYKDNPEELTNQSSRIKSEIENLNKLKNKEITAKEYLENTKMPYAMSQDLSVASNEEIETMADLVSKDFEDRLNPAKQKAQAETVTKTEEKVTEPTAETRQPTAKAEDLKLNVKSTTNGLVNISNQENEIEDIDEVSMSRGMPDQYKNSFINKDGELQIKLPAMDFMGRQGGHTLIKLKTPEGFNEQEFSDRLSKIKHDEFKTTSKSVPSVVNQVRQAISESITQPKTQDATQQAAKESVTEKQPTKEAVAAKNLADFLRTGKMEKGTAMALPLPGFDKLWNGTIETVAKAIEVGGVTAGNFRQSVEDGMKALKNTPAFKSITDPKERAKISREYKKQLLEKIPQFFNINTDDLRTGEFTDFNQKLEESKGKDLSTKELNKLKAEAKKFVTNNLPADKFRKSEVLSYVRNNFDKAKTVEDIQTNLDKVNNIMATKEAKIQKETEKQEAKDKKTLIKEIEGKIAANSRKVISKNRRTGAKKGKITLGSQQQINQLIQGLKDQGLFNNLDKMTDQELVTLNETIDNILTTGRVEQKQINAIEEAKKRTDKAMILEALSDKPDKYLEGQEEIMQALDEESGIVIVDGQAMNKQAFEEYAKQNPDAELETVPFYYRRDAKEIKEDLKRDKTFRKGLRNITLFTVRDLETYIKKLGSGSKEFRTWLEESIAKPIREGRLKSVETIWNKTREYQKATKKIFGTDALGRNKMYDTLVEVTDIKPKNSKANLSAGQVVHLYGILNNPDKDKAEANAKRLQKYNGILAKEVIDFMENPDNKVLMDYYNFLKDKYNVEFRDEFGPSIEQLHNIVLEDKYYYPEPASGAATEAENILDLENKTVSLSAIAPNMRHRKDAVSVPFELVDAHEMFLRYVQSMAHAKEFIPATKAAYTLLSDMNKPYVMEKFGSVTEYNDFVKTLSIAVTDNTPYQTDAFTTVNNWTALTLLWFRLKAVPQQLSAAVHYYGAGIKDGVMPWDVARALPVTTNDFKFVKNFYFDNPYLYTRLSGGNITPEMQALKNQIDGNVNKYKRGVLNAVQFIGLFPIKGGDAAASALPGGGMNFALAQFRNKYNETGDYELSKQFAKQRWMEETERTQQPSLAKEAISTASYNNVVRLLIPFSSAQNAIAKKSYKAYIDIFKDWNSLDNNEKAQAVSDLVYYPVFANMPFILTGGVGFALWRMLFDDEEEDTLKDAQKKRMYYDLAMETIQANATSAGVLGKTINTFINIARDKEFFNEVPLLQKGTDLSKLAYEVILVDNDLSEMTKEQRLKFYKEHSGADDPLGRTEFSSEQEYNEWVENVYKPTPFYKKMTEKEVDLTKKVLGVKNLFTMIQDMKDFAASEKGISDIIELTTGAEQKRNELNKNLDPYFNQAIQFDKQDKLFEKIYDEDYVLKQIDEQQGVSTSKDIRSAIKALKPKKPKIPRPR